MIPGRRLLILATLMVGISCVLVAVPGAMFYGYALLAVLGVVAAVDLLSAWKMTPSIQMRRVLPGRFALGVRQVVGLVLRQDGRRTLAIELFDGVPDRSDVEGFPWHGQLPPAQDLHVRYEIGFDERGEVPFGRACVMVDSPLGLWQRRLWVGDEEVVKVYPNYKPVLDMALLAMDSRRDEMGLRYMRRAGASREFLQLRDYQLGDGLNTVDWKATSRFHRLISREYEEQRNQTLIFMLDSGRRMRAMDHGLPQFDHCLNAILLVAYVALNQGTQVGVLGFGEGVNWLPPVKGVQAMPRLLNHLFNAETTMSPSDYDEAATQLMVRQKRRAMVVMLTNLRGESPRELLRPLTVLKQKHHVVVASLREQRVEEMRNAAVGSAADGVRAAAAHLYVAERRKVAAEMDALGVPLVDATAHDFPVALANRYLADRARGAM
ncbi:DUF58 domain-containing protein [Sulfuriroseicoccus oceanibius]|uniref:DUF58 domain-containing protein n=1 Tax=Sulfuriroseicoccus oceanibius TaxID=2707525 RepID=A0A6B3LDR6_9BACT|nr:DUF58 domain-containing protein [Sulfuriroseicoccus oceanibius]QQL45696.1 DUF58 domain-containing protein [Sulfuriroseicoccus oceanibius]